MHSKYWIFIAIIALAILAGNFAYPNYYNQTVDFFNAKFGWQLPHFWQKDYILGLDLKGGVSLTYEADLTNAEDPAEAMRGLRDVIERRVNLFGVAEPSVQIQGDNRLVVDLPGAENVKEAIEMIGQTPFLEFYETRPEEETEKILSKIAETEGLTIEEIQQIENWELILENPYLKPTELTGQYLKRAKVIFDQTTGQPQIELEFNSEGAEIFREVTKRNIQKPLAIFLDDYSIIDTTGDGVIDEGDLYAPIVQGEIPSGKAYITGSINRSLAVEIVRRLNSGALPVKIGQPILQQTVGPTLGSVSLEKSLWAGFYGLLAVIIFMIIFYRLPGLLASLALLIYVFLVLSVFKLVPITLTLAGIGGFILSVGMAVDANILIFARLKEEIRQGKNLPLSIQEGFKRAWPSIRDSNINSLIVAVILFTLTTSFVKGFALTLAIGIIVSMFSAILVTRVLLQVFLGRWAERAKWLL